jgi:hypothetical protein
LSDGKNGDRGHLKYHPALRYVQICSSEHTNGTSNKSPTRCNSSPVYYPDVYLSISRVWDLATPMQLGLKNWPFVHHVQSRGTRSITEAQDGPQAYTLNILRKNKKGAQMCMSE